MRGGSYKFEAIARVSIIPTVTCVIVYIKDILFEVTIDCDICKCVLLN